MGLYGHHCDMLDKKFSKFKPWRLAFYKESQQQTFMFFLNALELQDSHQPMTHTTFENPYNFEVQLIMYLYSIEPPFYADMNEACKKVKSEAIDVVKIK